MIYDILDCEYALVILDKLHCFKIILFTKKSYVMLCFLQIYLILSINIVLIRWYIENVTNNMKISST